VAGLLLDPQVEEDLKEIQMYNENVNMDNDGCVKQDLSNHSPFMQFLAGETVPLEGSLGT